MLYIYEGVKRISVQPTPCSDGDSMHPFRQMWILNIGYDSRLTYYLKLRSLYMFFVTGPTVGQI